MLPSVEHRQFGNLTSLFILIQIYYFRYLLFITRKTMSTDNRINVSFGEVNQKNINILRKINYSSLPVKYSTPFYIKVAMEYTKFSRYCFYNDIVIGAFATRVEDYKGQKHAYILTIGVLQPYRKFGIGRQMMNQLERILKQSQAVGIYLHMHVLNDTGKKFYQRVGFQVIQRIDNYYTDLQEPHCYILRKYINKQPNNIDQSKNKPQESKN